MFAIGFDIMLDDTALVEVVLPELRAAAATIGLPLIEVTTNLRGLGEHFGCSWGMDYHGAALGTIANLLSPQFSKVLIPSSRTYARLEPWGSHVLVDPLWSTSRMTVAHDGAEATRVEKCRAIADDDAAHQFLRVCHHNYGLGVYNCGRCEKCVSTAASALAAGVGDRFGTLPQPPLSAVLTTEFDVGPACHWRETRAELRRSGHRRLLRYAIDAALLRNRLARPFRRAKARITWAATHPRDLYRRIRKTPP